MVAIWLATYVVLGFVLTSHLSTATTAVEARVRRSGHHRNARVITTRQQDLLLPSAPPQSSKKKGANHVDRTVFRTLSVPEAQRARQNKSSVFLVKGRSAPGVQDGTWRNSSSSAEEVAVAEKQKAEEAAVARCSDFNTRLFSAMKILALSTEHVQQRLRQFRLDEVGTVKMNLVAGTKFHRARDGTTGAYATTTTMMRSEGEEEEEDGGEQGAGGGGAAATTLCKPTYRLRLSFDGYSLMDWTPAETQNLTAVSVVVLR